MSRNVTNRNQKLKNLSRLHHSMLDDYFDNELKRRLIRSYAAGDPEVDVTALIAQIEKHSNTISAKRKKKAY